MTILILDAAVARATALPVAVEPVKDIMGMRMWDAISSPVSRAPLRMLKIPSGRLYELLDGYHNKIEVVGTQHL